MFFWAMWFFILLLPHLNIVRLNALYAEHWIYAAAVGLYVILAAALRNLIQKGTHKKILSYSLTGFIIIYFSAQQRLSLHRSGAK